MFSTSVTPKAEKIIRPDQHSVDVKSPEKPILTSSSSGSRGSAAGPYLASKINLDVVCSYLSP